MSTQPCLAGPGRPVWRGKAEELLLPVLGPERARYAAELAPYLPGSVGNAQRIDYGTGHETAFAALLFCLARAGAVRTAWLGQGS